MPLSHYQCLSPSPGLAPPQPVLSLTYPVLSCSFLFLYHLFVTSFSVLSSWPSLSSYPPPCLSCLILLCSVLYSCILSSYPIFFHLFILTCLPFFRFPFPLLCFSICSILNSLNSFCHPIVDPCLYELFVSTIFIISP